MTVYLDMDGVIADFFGGIEELHNVDHWKDIGSKDKIISSIKHTDFFYDLEKFSTTNKLVEFVKNISNGDWGICSSPLEGDFNNSSYWKRRWLEKHNIMPQVEKCIFTDYKHEFAWSPLSGLPNILIDDKPANIKKWIDAGGIGIRYQANQDDLEEYLFIEIEKAVKKQKSYSIGQIA